MLHHKYLVRIRGPQNREDCAMSGAQRFIVLGVFFLGAAFAHKESQEGERSDVETGEKHVGCYYGAWAYTR